MVLLIAFVRRLQLHKPRLIICYSHLSRSGDRGLPFYFSRAFHRTSCRQLTQTRLIGSQPLYQITDFSKYVPRAAEDVQLGHRGFLDIVRNARDFASGDEAIAFLDDSGVEPDKDFVFSVIWAFREEWKLAFLVFKWGAKWDCVVEKTWCLMIWLLGNHNKFSTAWTVVHEVYGASKDTGQAMLIMIDRYAAANLPEKAIEAFHFMQKFSFSLESATYFTFLNILCIHGYIEEAEEFMLLNKKFFPLETESFNIILNGWCNILVDIYEAKRVWREMSKCCIEPDGTSYTHMISGNSRVCNLYESLRLYDEMKKRGWLPTAEVYHSLIYVLTHENCLSEALKILDRMKEAGFAPDSTTYNLIIRPLCETEKFKEARTMLARMLGEDIRPTIHTYHELLKGENVEGTLGVLSYMNKAGLSPNRDTFTFILDKHFKLGEPENALRIWSSMKVYEVNPDRLLYCTLVGGLTKCGLIGKAREFYSEMTSSGLVDDPSLKKLIEEQGFHSKKKKRKMGIVRSIKKGTGLGCGKSSAVKKRNHHKE